METPVQKTPVGLSILRWTARIVSLMLVGLFIFIFVIESMKSSGGFSSLRFIDIASFLVMLGYVAALMIGFKWEATGGTLTIICVVALAMIIFTARPLPFSLLFFIIPGLLYLLSWYLHKKYSKG